MRVTLEPTRARASPSFGAMPERQCTRGDYDSKPLSTEELSLLQRAGSDEGVRMLLRTERSATEQVRDHVVHGNTAQMADPAFVTGLKVAVFVGKAADNAHWVDVTPGGLLSPLRTPNGSRPSPLRCFRRREGPQQHQRRYVAARRRDGAVSRSDEQCTEQACPGNMGTAAR